MKDTNRIKLNLQYFAEEPTDPPAGGGEPQTVKLGDKEFTLEELQNKITGYEKLEKQFTKVSQENSELKKNSDKAKQWMEFDQYLAQFPQDVQQKFVEQVNTFFSAAQTGNVTQQDITGINKAIKAAEKVGDNKVADELKDARDDALAELMLDKEINSMSKQAKKDGIEFDGDEFHDYFVKYLEDEGYSDEDDVDIEREVKRAYKEYRLEKKEKDLEAKQKDKLPNVGTGGSGIGVGNQKPNKAPKNLKEAMKMAGQMLGG